MKNTNNKEVIVALNTVLKGELTAINQYFLHAKMCKNWGYEKLHSIIHNHSIGEMKHAATITDRVLFLEGLPNLQSLGKLNIGENVPEQISSDLKLELEAVKTLKEAIKVCQDNDDHVTEELLQTILEDEENHINWLETQLRLVKSLGKELYLSKQVQ